MTSFFYNVLQKQLFTDVLENRYSKKFPKFYRKTPVLESLFNKVSDSQASSFIKKILQQRSFSVKLAKFLRTPYFTEHLQWLLLWFLQQNNLLFSVITITLGYNQKLSWKYCNYYQPPYIKISISYQNYGHLAQKLCCLSRQTPNFRTISSI